MSEAPIVPGGAAIANAIHNACGARIRSLPCTPDKVLAALGKVS
jgi:xanthine dehydrogenase YagR molybdenum-binding subunit